MSLRGLAAYAKVGAGSKLHQQGWPDLGLLMSSLDVRPR